jgi:hypothetical protein
MSGFEIIEYEIIVFAGGIWFSAEDKQIEYMRHHSHKNIQSATVPSSTLMGNNKQAAKQPAATRN